MWWSSMSVFQQVMFVVACAATSVLVIQIVLMIIGGAADNGGEIGGASDLSVDADVDVDVDVDIDADAGFGGADIGIGGGPDGDISLDGGEASDAPQSHSSALPFGLKLLSLRAILAFIAVGGWVCYTVAYALDWYAALLIGIAAGFAAACGIAAALTGMEKLQSNGNIDPNNTIGKVGTVYLTVPPLRSGCGKINVVVQERFAEYEAMTDCGEPIPTGAEIKVLAHLGGNVLLVQKVKRPSITIENDGEK